MSMLKMVFGSRMVAACRRMAASSLDRRYCTKSQLKAENHIGAQRLRDFDALFPYCLDEVLKASSFNPALKEAIDYFKMVSERH